MRTAFLVLAATSVDALVLPSSTSTIAPRTTPATMQFGFQNYDRSVEKKKRGENPINYVNPFATGSTVRRSRQRSKKYARLRTSAGKSSVPFVP